MRNRSIIYWICQVVGWGVFVLGNVLYAVVNSSDQVYSYLITGFILLLTGLSVT
ncbi:MAG: hypothetical protein JNM00_13955, partial [Flavobacteriales bacterium]|nr:hypothetical protein [Flavobacteriales bacterium]